MVSASSPRREATSTARRKMLRRVSSPCCARVLVTGVPTSASLWHDRSLCQQSSGIGIKSGHGNPLTSSLSSRDSQRGFRTRYPAARPVPGRNLDRSARSVDGSVVFSSNFTPDGSLVFASDLYALNSSGVRRITTLPLSPYQGDLVYDPNIRGFDVSPDGSRLAVATQRSDPHPLCRSRC